MKAPAPTFEITYAHDRRQHRHRCRCCSKIIQDGARVLMVRLQKKTWAVHIECADKVNTPAGWTWRDSFEAWGTSHLRAIGWKLPEHPMAQAGAAKTA